MGRRRSGKIRNRLLTIVGVALYLNIGWAIGTYMYYNVDTKTPAERSVLGNALAGPGNSLGTKNDKEQAQELARGPLSTQIVCSLTWPFMILFLTIFWTGYGIVLLLGFIFNLIFVGGLAKLFGLG